MAFERELSIVAARAVDGTVACYPVVENRHADGILRTTLAPAPGLTAGAAGRRRGASPPPCSTRLDYVGVLAVELFAVDGAAAGQRGGAARAQLRALDHRGRRDEPVRAAPAGHLRAAARRRPTVRRPVAMVNLIGSLPDVAALLAVPGAHVHLYGKAPRPARKLGHVTVPLEHLAAVEALLPTN